MTARRMFSLCLYYSKLRKLFSSMIPSFHWAQKNISLTTKKCCKVKLTKANGKCSLHRTDWQRILCIDECYSWGGNNGMPKIMHIITDSITIRQPACCYHGAVDIHGTKPWTNSSVSLSTFRYTLCGSDLSALQRNKHTLDVWNRQKQQREKKNSWVALDTYDIIALNWKQISTEGIRSKLDSEVYRTCLTPLISKPFCSMNENQK